jgi:hypothetical protein
MVIGSLAPQVIRHHGHSIEHTLQQAAGHAHHERRQHAAR